MIRPPRILRGRSAAVVILMAIALQPTLASNAHGQVEAKKAEAATLQAKIDRQGSALSIADEEFNVAQIERQQIDARAARARDQVEAAGARWGEMKAQLARRVRLLYMHPGAALDVWLSQRSLGDLARAQKLSSEVVTADSELVNTTERARQTVLTRARALDGLRDDARAKERELAGRRADLSTALQEQRTLLTGVEGDIAKLIAEQRAQELARASAPRPNVEGNDAGAPPTSSPERFGPPPPVKSGAAKVVAVAAAQIGKPYEWAAAGPDSFDCSGLALFAWAAAGVSLVHSSRAQFASLPHIDRSQLQPGDLVFYGSPIHHMGIYEGGGVMIDAPETGEFVRRDSIARPDWAGAARP